ncbi:MAG TPA: MdtA/MuxA family multidrug efflux RND transporter periplasmic adaptor subunit [Thermoanaerobaculia bacterium]|nr:MdtA/MuxA family multidrug efflux RND transporter periplasmic adaptor subunit [Thermoanaerobaculia bacterium]
MISDETETQVDEAAEAPEAQPTRSPRGERAAPPAPRRDTAAAAKPPDSDDSDAAGHPSDPSAPSDRTGTPRRRRLWVWLLVLALVALGIYLFVHQRGKAKAQSAQAASAAAASRPVPVGAATATTKDVGVYLTGLGTVTPLGTVTVRSRVDGQLIRLAFQEGQLVHAGNLIAELDPRPFQVQLMQAEGQRAKDEAALRNAQVDLARYQVLITQDAIPKQQLDTQAATVQQFQAALKSDQAQIESAKLNLTYSRITAPTTGRVGLRLVDPGNIVHASDPNGIVVITQLQPIDVLFTLPADQLPQVLQQLHAGRTLPVDAYDRDLKKKLAQGTLLAVDNQIDPTTGTVRLKAIFTNQDEPLFPNQFVNARLLVDTLHGAVTVPAAAIQRSPQSSFVYVVKPDKTVETRNVEPQLTEGDETSLRRGLAAGEVVVVDGVDKLRPGMKVDVTGGGGGAGGGAAAGGAGGAGARGAKAAGAAKGQRQARP